MYVALSHFKDTLRKLVYARQGTAHQVMADIKRIPRFGKRPNGRVKSTRISVRFKA